MNTADKKKGRAALLPLPAKQVTSGIASDIPETLSNAE